MVNWLTGWSHELGPSFQLTHISGCLTLHELCQTAPTPKCLRPISRNRIAAGWWAEHANTVEFVCLLMLRAVFTCKGAESVLSPRQTSQLSLRVRLNFPWTPDRHRVPVDEPSSIATVLRVGGPPPHWQPLGCSCAQGVERGSGTAAIVTAEQEARGRSLSKLALQGVPAPVAALLCLSAESADDQMSVRSFLRLS